MKYEKYKTRQKLTVLFLVIVFIISLFVTSLSYKNKYPNDYKMIKIKTESIDKNSIEFFIGDNSLDKTYNKIKNEKFDEIDLVDKQKINNILKSYGENEHNYIFIDGTKIKLNDFLKNNDTEIKKYLPSIDNEIKYFTIFYKIVIDKNESYVKYLDKNVNEKLVKQATINKQITTTRDSAFFYIFLITILSTTIIVIIANLIFDAVVYISKKI